MPITITEIKSDINTGIRLKTEPHSATRGEVSDILDKLADYTEQEIGCKSFVVSLTQTGTDAPAVDVLKNTLGYTPPIGYVGTGNYGIAITDLDPSKTAIFISPRASAAKQLIPFTSVTGNNIFLRTYNKVTDALENDMLLNTIVKIEIYP